VKVLLDECVPWPVHRLLSAHDCQPVQRCGWAGIKNGELLKLAEGQFDLFITSDQSLRYQQNLTGRKIAILQLSTNKWARILAATALLDDAVSTIRPGEFRQLRIP
jgi:hypothetical protein